jgi:hypothetical protein
VLLCKSLPSYPSALHHISFYFQGAILDPEHGMLEKKNLVPWPESPNELYRLSERRFSAKLGQTFADREYHVVSVTDLYGRILAF